MKQRKPTPFNRAYIIKYTCFCEYMVKSGITMYVDCGTDIYYQIIYGRNKAKAWARQQAEYDRRHKEEPWEPVPRIVDIGDANTNKRLIKEMEDYEWELECMRHPD